MRVEKEKNISLLQENESYLFTSYKNKPMSKVNLDALIPKLDFDDSEPPNGQQKDISPFGIGQLLPDVSTNYASI